MAIQVDSDRLRKACFEMGIIFDTPLQREDANIIGFKRKRPIFSDGPIDDPTVPSETGTDTISSEEAKEI